MKTDQLISSEFVIRKMLGLNGFVYDDENRIPMMKSMNFTS